MPFLQGDTFLTGWLLLYFLKEVQESREMLNVKGRDRTQTNTVTALNVHLFSQVTSQTD